MTGWATARMRSDALVSAMNEAASLVDVALQEIPMVFDDGEGYLHAVDGLKLYREDDGRYLFGLQAAEISDEFVGDWLPIKDTTEVIPLVVDGGLKIFKSRVT